MKIGAAVGYDRLDRLEELGFDLTELSVGWLSEQSGEEVEKIRAAMVDKHIQWKSCNCLFPGSLTPLYRDEDFRDIRAYLNRMLPMLARFGVETVVFGSGSFRRMPEEMPQQQRRQIMCAFLTVLERIARENGLVVVIEPLNQSETNMLVTTEEAAGYIRELNLPNLKLLVDLFHFCREGEPLERICEYGPYIRHIHIAEPTRRDHLRCSDDYDYAPFFDALNAIGYNGAVVFEGGQGDFDTGIRETVQVLRRYCGG